MTCEKCGNEKEDVRACETIFHVWMRLGPKCRGKYAARDDKGSVIYYDEKRHERLVEPGSQQ